MTSSTERQTWLREAARFKAAIHTGYQFDDLYKTSLSKYNEALFI